MKARFSSQPLFLRAAGVLKSRTQTSFLHASGERTVPFVVPSTLQGGGFSFVESRNPMEGLEGKQGRDLRGQNLSEAGAWAWCQLGHCWARLNPQVPGGKEAEILEFEFLIGWIFFWTSKALHKPGSWNSDSR